MRNSALIALPNGSWRSQSRSSCIAAQPWRTPAWGPPSRAASTATSSPSASLSTTVGSSKTSMIMRGLPSCRGRFGYASVLLCRIGQDFSGDAGEGLGEMVEEIGVPPTADESGDDLTAEAQNIGIVEAVVQRHGHVLEVSGDVREHVVTVEVDRQPHISQRLYLEGRAQVVE